MRLPFFAVEQGLLLEKTVLNSVIDTAYSIEPESFGLFDKTRKKQRQSPG